MPYIQPRPVQSQQPNLAQLAAILARAGEERRRNQLNAYAQLGSGIAGLGQGVGRGMRVSGQRQFQAGESEKARQSREDIAEKNRQAMLERAKIPYQFNVNKQKSPAEAALEDMDNENVPVNRNVPGLGQDVPPKIRKRVMESTKGRLAGPMDLPAGLRQGNEPAEQQDQKPDVPQGTTKGASPIIRPAEKTGRDLVKDIRARLEKPTVKNIRQRKDGKYRPEIGANSVDDLFDQQLAALALNDRSLTPEDVVDVVYETMADHPGLKERLEEIGSKKLNTVLPTTLYVVPDGPQKGAWKDVRTDKIVLPPPMNRKVMMFADPYTATQQVIANEKHKRIKESLQKKWGGQIRPLTPDSLQLVAELDEPIPAMELVYPREAAKRFVQAVRSGQLRNIEERR